MRRNGQRKIRMIIMVLKRYRDRYAKVNNTGISSKFSRAMALLMEILEEMKNADDVP